MLPVHISLSVFTTEFISIELHFNACFTSSKAGDMFAKSARLYYVKNISFNYTFYIRVINGLYLTIYFL